MLHKVKWVFLSQPNAFHTVTYSPPGVKREKARTEHQTSVNAIKGAGLAVAFAQLILDGAPIKRLEARSLQCVTSFIFYLLVQAFVFPLLAHCFIHTFIYSYDHKP
jgi:hypothetical protein